MVVQALQLCEMEALIFNGLCILDPCYISVFWISHHCRMFEYQCVLKLIPCISFSALCHAPQEMVEAAGEDERELAAEMAASFLNENLPESIFGAPKAGNGQWASVIRVMNPIQGNTLDLVQLEQNEAAFR